MVYRKSDYLKETAAHPTSTRWPKKAPFANSFERRHPWHDVACNNIARPVQALLGSWIVAECLLRGERHHYLPVGIPQGRLSHELIVKPSGYEIGGEK